jgi:hypothetical protein
MNDSGNRSQPTATVFASLSRFRGRRICHRLPRVATAGLHKGSILSCLSRIRVGAVTSRLVQSGSSNGGTTTAVTARCVQALGGAALDELRHDLEDAAARRTTSSPALAGAGVQGSEFEHWVPIGLGDEGIDGSISVRTEVSSCLGGDSDVTL